MQQKRNIGSWILGLSMLFVASLFVGRAAASHPEPPSRTEASEASIEAVPRPGRQLVLVYVGSSRCGPSNAPDLPGVVGAISALLRSAAREDRLGFVRIGVAREISARSGLEHLSKFGGFDEISVGQGVLNTASAKYISVDHKGVAATPQLLVVDRRIGEVLGSVDPVAADERVLLRKVGLAEISDWLKLGAPLPQRYP